MGLTSIKQYLKRAVYDALTGASSPSASNVFVTTNDIKEKTFILTTESSHTGDLVETNLNSILIPANTFQEGDIIEMYYAIAKTGSGGTAQFRIRVSTTQGSVTGYTIVYHVLSNTFTSNQRTFKVNSGGGLSGYNTSNTYTTFFGVNNFDKATRTVGVADWTINQYLNINVLLTILLIVLI